jgi:acyl-CoA synthetase (AMP-forming)/AMP-acid ligase II
MQNNVGLFLSKRAQLNPDLEAIVDADTGRRLSFGDLNRRANRVADLATKLGVKKGDRVALLLMNCSEYVESFFGLAKIGAIVVPLNWRLVPDELAYILKDSGASVLIYGGEFAETVADLHDRDGAGADLEHWVEVGEAGSRQVFAEPYGALVEAASDDEPDIAAADDDLLFIMYTSGTTGHPKGAVQTHHTVLWACLTFKASAEMRFKDRFLNPLPMFHVGALVPLILDVYTGVTTIMMRQFDPGRTWQTIQQEQATIMIAVPAMLNFMLQVPQRETCDVSSLRWCMSGAAPVPVALMTACAENGIEVHQVYGLTEACGPACLIGPDDAVRRVGSTGKAFFHTDVRLVDADGRDVAPGEPGELIVRGQHVMKGYWNNPTATAETIRDGWLHTGDVATIDEAGFITILDRTKDMIISGGENVYPAEIEEVITGHAKVAEVAVIGQPSEHWGESPIAVVVKADETLSEADVMRHCDGKLARYKLPKGVAFIDEIPRNPSGKALKRLLREQFL